MYKHPASVLIVEDDEAQGRQLRSLLLTCFNRVDVVTSGSMALQLLSTSPALYDVIVLDRVFEEGPDGFECLHRLKQGGVRAEVILLTAYGDKEAALAGLRAGAFRYMIKPPHEEELLANIEAAYDITNLRGANTRLAREGQEWKNSAVKLALAAGLALVPVVVLSVTSREHFVTSLLGFAICLLILLTGWQGFAKVIFSLKHKDNSLTLDMVTTDAPTTAADGNSKMRDKNSDKQSDDEATQRSLR